MYIADLSPVRGAEIRKARSVEVVSRDEMNRPLETVVVCSLISRLHPHQRSRLQVRWAGQDAETDVDRIRTIGKQRLGKRLDGLSAIPLAFQTSERVKVLNSPWQIGDSTVLSK